MRGKIRIVEAVNQLGLGGTEYVLQLYSKFLNKELFSVTVIGLLDGGPRVKLIQDLGIEVVLLNGDLAKLTEILLETDVFHWHGNGLLDPGLFNIVKANKPKLVIQTNVFGLYEPSDFYDIIDYDLYVSKMVLIRRMGIDKSLKDHFSSKRKVLHNPIDVDQINSLLPDQSTIAAFKEKHHLQGYFIVGRIGRADDNKFDLITLDGFAEFAKKVNSARFLLLGATPNIIAHAELLGVSDKLVLFENTSDLQELLVYYKTMDVFLAASNIGESFGMVIAEAMTAGIPVITISTEDRDNAQIELVDNNETGFVVKRKKEKIASAIHRLYQDRNLRNRFSRSSAKKTLDAYKASRIVKSFEQLIFDHLGIPIKTSPETLLLDFSQKIVDDYSNRCIDLYGSGFLKRVILFFKRL
ncbi:glycosyltransferase involved in cell wall biosynthesis [Pedobacter africanus]|uniref:Glycosyltransferase involved in cell wall biosynthesis n=1 Tax=Pedobacter africanus TaxID=151894 RepID=A0ACC6L3V8_9SPHI|nr:glycosyltransferase [Pedobacter africanus]MDR6785973.1 glycosyltransferase involved in cell wall biosynthesis [Pedobacter africanus]